MSNLRRVLLAFSVAVTAVHAVETACTESSALDQDTYFSNNPVNVNPDSGSSSSPGITGDDGGWLGRGFDAVDDVSFKLRKRDDFTCVGDEKCLDHPIYGLSCYSAMLKSHDYAAGYRMNYFAGSYTAPDGKEGDFYKGPCPGDWFAEADTGTGCKNVEPAERQESNSGSADGGNGGSDSGGDEDSDSDRESGGAAGRVDALAVGLSLVAGITLSILI